MVTIPWFDSANFTQEVTLDNTPFNLRFAWISRTGAEFWMMDILSIDNDELLTGRRLVIQGEYLRQHAGRNLPPGMMSAVDETGSTAPIEQDDFLNGRVNLVYSTESEIEAL